MKAVAACFYFVIGRTAGAALLIWLLSAGATNAQESGLDYEWHRAAHDLANTRYSKLAQIKPDNVGRLQVAWTFSTGVNRGREAAPIVAGDTMYVVTPYPTTRSTCGIRA